MMAASLPRDVARGVVGALAPSDRAKVEIRSLRTVGGGCIHPAVRVETTKGTAAFVKWSPDPGPTGFGVEARGLDALRRRGGVPVPEVLGVEEGQPGQRGWLALEWIQPGPATPDTPSRLGEGLAHLHRPLSGAAPGWDEDGWIATLPQPNPAGLDWPTFWARARLEPQWRRARESGRLGRSEDAQMERLLDLLPDALAGWADDGIALLHGDLWSGNLLVGREGTPHLVDPAAYCGHREVDLAMMELFGGFEEGVFSAYRAHRPVSPAYGEIRRRVYQLYPLLVHVNLFGGGYVGRTLRTLAELLARLR